MKDVLDKLFGSSARVRIIRLFLNNSSDLFNSKEVSRRCNIKSNIARREISFLVKIGLLKNKKEFIDTLVKLKNGKVKNKKKKIEGTGLNEFFPLLESLRNLFLGALVFDKEKMIKSLKSSGDIKIIILSGIFMSPVGIGGQVDLLLVGDKVKKVKLDNVLRKTERDLGREISFVLFDTKEFLYRFSMYDKFLRDVFDSPHEKALNILKI